MSLWLGICSPARAQLDPELDKPYRLQVVLHIADNRFLTPLFQDQVQRDLRDMLQLALGGLARVEVSRSHPLLREIEAKGLENGLDGWEQISGVKTHFVLVDFAAGVYSLKARQYDGTTGLLSPVVRRADTSDRGLVAQTAARLVDQDFGLVGTVVEAGKEVKLALKGGKLGVDLGRWVKPGDVFAVSRIMQEGDKRRGLRVPWALLEVVDAPREGTCRCRLHHRFLEDNLQPQPGVLGYRCLKLTTTQAPLKLRLIDDGDFRPLGGVQVHVLGPGSDKKSAELSTNPGGLAQTRDSYRNMALVRVVSGDNVRAQFPVELVDERTIVCRLKIQAEAEGQAPVEFRRDLWVRRLYDNLRLASERVALLNQQLNQSLEGALETARTGLKSMDDEVKQLASERGQIERQATEKKMAKLDLSEGDQRLGELKARQKDLERFVVRIEEVLKKAQNEKELGLDKMLERARLLEGEAEFEQAIALYEKVLEASSGQTKVREHLDRLKKDWTPKGPKHAEARSFLVQTWPRLEAAELKKNLDKARESLALCKEAQDRLTPLKMLRANVAHAANLKKQLDALKRQDSEDNRSQAKVIAQVAEGLRSLHAEASILAGKAK